MTDKEWQVVDAKTGEPVDLEVIVADEIALEIELRPVSVYEWVLRRIRWKNRRADPTVVRVSGDMRCPDCLRKFRDHPANPLYDSPGFVMLCDGTTGKT